MSSAEAALLSSSLLADGAVTLDGHTLERADVDIDFVAKEGFAAAGARAGVVVLDTKLDAELKDLGLVREVLSRVQAVRKELGLEYADRIRLYVHSPGETGPHLEEVLRAHVKDVVEGIDVVLGIGRA